jgi:hypothetical protein
MIQIVAVQVPVREDNLQMSTYHTVPVPVMEEQRQPEKEHLPIETNQSQRMSTRSISNMSRKRDPL